MTSTTLRKMCVLAGIAVLAATAAAGVFADGQISIDRALNSPTLTVRYEGVNAALVELRVNGESLGTRSVASSKSTGETNFTLNLSELKDGDNEVEIRLFDRTGKLVGSQKSGISTDQTNYGPVFLKTPKMGETVAGPVEIDMGFGRDLKNVFVSFFVDNNWKKMTNYPPYIFTWDTTGETNGWHEIEAWAIDESSTTYKTRKTRVFVNNPGGRTDRPGIADLEPTQPKLVTGVVGSPAGVKSVSLSEHSQMVSTAVHSVTPTTTTGALISNPIRVSVGTMSGFKPALSDGATPTGPRSITPSTHASVPVAAPRPTAPTVVARRNDSPQIMIAVHGTQPAPDLTAGGGLLRITKGQRLPNLSTFEIVFNSSIVDFPDVQPRVDDGIPMTPFRYLFEKTGGTVDWANLTKTVTARTDGHDVSLRIGDKLATVNSLQVRMELAPYIDRGRTIVPLSFIDDALNVNVDYDKETGHVLITSKNK